MREPLQKCTARVGWRLRSLSLCRDSSSNRRRIVRRSSWRRSEGALRPQMHGAQSLLPLPSCAASEAAVEPQCRAARALLARASLPSHSLPLQGEPPRAGVKLLPCEEGDEMMTSIQVHVHVPKCASITRPRRPAAPRIPLEPGRRPRTHARPPPAVPTLFPPHQLEAHKRTYIHSVPYVLCTLKYR